MFLTNKQLYLCEQKKPGTNKGFAKINGEIMMSRQTCLSLATARRCEGKSRFFLHTQKLDHSQPFFFASRTFLRSVSFDIGRGKSLTRGEIQLTMSTAAAAFFRRYFESQKLYSLLFHKLFFSILAKFYFNFGRMKFYSPKCGAILSGIEYFPLNVINVSQPMISWHSFNFADFPLAAHI